MWTQERVIQFENLGNAWYNGTHGFSLLNFINYVSHAYPRPLYPPNCFAVNAFVRVDLHCCVKFYVRYARGFDWLYTRKYSTRDSMNGFRLPQKLTAVRLTQAVLTISCTFTHVKLVKYSCVTDVKFTQQWKFYDKLSSKTGSRIKLFISKCVIRTSIRFVLSHQHVTLFQ